MSRTRWVRGTRWGGPVGVLPRPLPVLTAPAVVPTPAAAAGRVGLATEKATTRQGLSRSGA